MLKKLSLFCLVTAVLSAAQSASSPSPLLRIVLVGDSTVATNGGWGPGFCATVAANVACINMAKGGRSTFSYRAEGSWQQVLDELKRHPNFHQTYVLIQFGHNDQPGKPGRSTDLATEFPRNLTNYVTDVKATGAQPVLITPLTRRWFKEGQVNDTLLPWAEAAKKVAQEQRVPFLDLHHISLVAVQAMGAVEANTLAMAPPTPEAAEAARRGESVPVPKTPAPPRQPQTTPRPSSSPISSTSHSVPVFDYTHLGEKGAAFFGRMAADELVRTVPGLRPYIRP